MDDDFENLDSVFLTKKKKKKKVIDLDVTSDLNNFIEEKEEEPVFETSIQDAGDDGLDLECFGKKKKKKKKVALSLDEALDLDQNASDTSDQKPGSSKKDPQGSQNDEIDLDMDFSMTKKKKKIKKKNLEDLVGAGEVADLENIEFETPKSSWTDHDRDYTYDELLTRVFDIIYEKNPDAASGRKQKFVMRPPQVLRVGTKKTSFANFLDIARTLHRVPKHLMDFVLSELGTSGSMDGYQQLVIKGRFQSKQIENVLRRYVKEYVTCHTCRSPNTTLQKDTRLYFLQCETCGSRCSVASIKSGFQAITSKRAKMRGRNSN